MIDASSDSNEDEFNINPLHERLVDMRLPNRSEHLRFSIDPPKIDKLDNSK